MHNLFIKLPTLVKAVCIVMRSIFRGEYPAHLFLRHLISAYKNTKKQLNLKKTVKNS